MEVLFFLIPVSVALAAGFTIACLGSIRSGQFDDMESPRWRMLFDRIDPAAHIDPDETLAATKTLNAAPETHRSKSL